nr:MAG TPA: hypothetical protein [Caudoviricetes sp.]
MLSEVICDYRKGCGLPVATVGRKADNSTDRVGRRDDKPKRRAQK